MADRSLSTSLDSSVWFDVSPEQLSNGSAHATFPFTEEVISDIRSRRLALDGTLFFDELLILAGLGEAADTYFPPSTPQDLASLLSEIDRCDIWEQLRKDCLCYYLLKFWREEDGENRAKRYQSSRLIPQGFAILADAYFHLDEGDSESAVRCLTDMRVQPDFIPKIMHTLSVSAPPSLVLRFVRLAKPPLTDQESLDIYVGALCAGNVVTALLYVRNFPESSDETAQRARLTGMILNSCLMPKPRPDALNTLLSFPLTTYEQLVLNTYALRPPPSLPESSLAILQDLIIVRLIHQGKYSDAISLDKLFVSEAANSGRIGSGGEVKKASEARRETFQEILAVLPDIQRRLLDVSLDPVPQAKPSISNMPNGNHIEPSASATDLTMSWEELGKSSYTLSSSVMSSRTPRPSARRQAPPTPLSASVAFRSATNPKVAVLRAFAHATPSAPSLGGSPLIGTSSMGARLEGSPAPSSRPFLNQSSASALGASTSSTAPSSPFNVTSPFASRPRLSFTPMQHSRAGQSSGTASRSHPLQQSTSTFLFGGAPTASTHTTPFGSPSPAPREVSTKVKANGKVNGSAKAPTPSTLRYENERAPSTSRAGSSANINPQPPKRSNLTSSNSWGDSLFGPPKATIPPPAPPPPADTNDPEQVFKPQRNLLRTPYVASSRHASSASDVPPVPPVPSLTNRLLGQSTSTPTKKRGLDEMQQDLWGAGDETVDDKVEFIVPSDDEDSVILPSHTRQRSSGPAPSSTGGLRSSVVMEDDEMEEAEGEGELEGEDQDEEEEDELDDDAADDEEAEAELLRAEEGSELPGAFPRELSTPPPLQEERPRRARRGNSEDRAINSSWIGSSVEPETREVKPRSTKSSSRAPRGSSISANGDAAPPAITKGKSKSTTKAAPKPISKRSTRASSAASDAPTEDTEPEDEPTAGSRRSSSRNLRRSARNSTTPTEEPQAPKTKRLRASRSPTRAAAEEGSGKPKRKTRGGSTSRASSIGPPPSTSSRLTRRGATVLESLEE